MNLNSHAIFSARMPRWFTPAFLLFFGMMTALLPLACTPEAEPEAELSPAESRLVQIAQVEEQFRVLMTQNPNSPEFRPRARFLAEEYRMFAYLHPEHEQAPEMLFLAANLTADALDQPVTAINLFRQLAREWPGTLQAERALFLAGYTYHHALGDFDNARAMYNRLLETYPETTLRQAAEDDMAFMGVSPDELLRKLQENMH